MPVYLRKGQKQHTTQEANEARLVTKVRWTVESFHDPIKKVAIFLRTNRKFIVTKASRLCEDSFCVVKLLSWINR